MDQIQELILSFPSQYIYLRIAGLIMITSLGIFPSSIDINLAVAGGLAGLGKADILILLPSVITALLTGELLMYSIGKKWGDKIYQFKFVKKVFPQKRVIKLETFLNNNPARFIFSVRISPILRPYLYVVIGAFNLSKKKFIQTHVPITVAYGSAIVIGTFYFSRLLELYLANYKIYGMITIILIWALIIRSIAKSYSIEPIY